MKRPLKSTLFVTLIALFLALPTLGNGVLTTSTDEMQKAVELDQKLIDQWGIELTALRMTAANRMIDFRYRVIDAEKATPLFKRQTKPYLVHQKSGKVLAVPNTAKIGSLRNSNTPKQGKIYWMFFGNNGLVQAGDKVDVVIGQFKAENLVVQ